jgi:hypothetical protein
MKALSAPGITCTWMCFTNALVVIRLPLQEKASPPTLRGIPRGAALSQLAHGCMVRKAAAGGEDGVATPGLHVLTARTQSSPPRAPGAQLGDAKQDSRIVYRSGYQQVDTTP